MYTHLGREKATSVWVSYEQKGPRTNRRIAKASPRVAQRSVQPRALEQPGEVQEKRSRRTQVCSKSVLRLLRCHGYLLEIPAQLSKRDMLIKPNLVRHVLLKAAIDSHFGTTSIARCYNG